jgi:hypothetical protein
MPKESANGQANQWRVGTGAHLGEGDEMVKGENISGHGLLL